MSVINFSRGKLLLVLRLKIMSVCLFVNVYSEKRGGGWGVCSVAVVLPTSDKSC